MQGALEDKNDMSHEWLEQFRMYDKIYVFCVNLSGMILANHLRLMGMSAEYIDNDIKWGKTLVFGQKCNLPENADSRYPCIIAAQNEKNKIDIHKQLLQIGFTNIHFIDEAYNHDWLDCYAPMMSDELYLRIFWFWRNGNEIDLEHPHTFNEKIQWLKLNDRNPEYVRMTDKYEVKEYVAEKIGEQYVIPTIGIYDTYDEIDFAKLPSQFVMKCTHDSGGIEICKDKSIFDFGRSRQHIEKCLSYNYFYYEREYSYKEIKPRIIIEEYMSDCTGSELKDYKIFCFNGEPQIIEVDIDRSTNHRRNLYTTEWELLDLSICYPKAPEIQIEKPDCIKELLDAARKLSEGIPHVRTDFYVIDNRIYFGEMTFYHGGGYEKFTPDEWNRKLGDYITVV